MAKLIDWIIKMKYYFSLINLYLYIKLPIDI
jgi:hypothetical protein